MERLRALFGNAQQYLAAASPREKRLVYGASAAVLVFAVLIGWASFSSAIRKRESSLEEKRVDFEKVQKLAAGYSVQEQERQLLEAKLRQSPPTLMSFVYDLAQKEGIDVSGMQDRGVQSGGVNGKPKESSVEVNLLRVPLDKLGRLLQSIERSQGVVRVRHLRVRRSSENKDVLDVTLTVSAWQGA